MEIGSEYFGTSTKAKAANLTFVAIEGCLAVGKTTLAKILAKHYESRVLIEDVSHHPFISDFYKNRERYAIETELGFVLLHYHQLRVAEEKGIFKGNVFSDFFIDKDRIFPFVTLPETRSLKVFNDVFSLCKSRVRKPDLVVFLEAESDFLYSRIKRRGRTYEEGVTVEYVNQINKAYERFFQNYDEAEVVRLDAQALDNLPSSKILARVGMTLQSRLRGLPKA